MSAVKDIIIMCEDYGVKPEQISHQDMCSICGNTFGVTYFSAFADMDIAEKEHKRMPPVCERCNIVTTEQLQEEEDHE